MNKQLKKLYAELEAARLDWHGTDPCGYEYPAKWHDLEMIAYEISEITGEHIDDLTL